MFHTQKNTKVLIDDNRLHVNQFTLNTNANLVHPIVVGERASFASLANNPTVGTLELSYSLTGKDFLKEYINLNADYPISGQVNGVFFRSGFLDTYRLSVAPNSPIEVNASIIFFEEIQGKYKSESFSSDLNPTILNTSDIILSGRNGNYVPFLSSDNILSLNWSFKSDVKPVYFAKGTGLSSISPDRIYVGKKSINTDIIFDSTEIDLSYQGEDYKLDVVCGPEVFACDGNINQKTLEGNANNPVVTKVSIYQENINKNTINNTYTLLKNGSYDTGLTITATKNNLMSQDNRYSYVENVYYGNQECKFSVNSQNTTNDILTCEFPSDAISGGQLLIQTTKGTILYPDPIRPNFAPPSITSFSPSGAPYNSLITISGDNFIRVSDVLFNNKKSNFSVSGNNVIFASVPYNAFSGPIVVRSTDRGTSGVSNGKFYAQPIIYSMSDPTGLGNEILTIAGKNLDKVTGVLYNHFTGGNVYNASDTSVQINFPTVDGIGFPKGPIQLLSYPSVSTTLPYEFRPTILITEAQLVPISNTPSGRVDFNIWGNWETGRYNKYLNGYKASIKDVIFPFNFKAGQTPYEASGYIPITGVDFKSGHLAVYQPDGVTQYQPYSTPFAQTTYVKIDSVSPNLVKKYQSFNTIVYGKYFSSFSSLPWYFGVSGFDCLYTGAITVDGQEEKITSARISITGSTGWYNVVIRNTVGNSTLNECIYVDEPTNWAEDFGVASQSLYEDTARGAGKAIDGLTGSFSLTSGVTQDKKAWWQVTFTPVITVNELVITGVPDYMAAKLGKTPHVVETGYILMYNKQNACIYGSGAANTPATGRNNLLSTHLYFTNNPITGVYKVKIFSSGAYLSNDKGRLGFNEIEIY